MLIKVLDGCGINDRFWVLAAGTTDVEYTLRVTDLLTDGTRAYSNPLGEAAPAIVDTDDAFATCDATPARETHSRPPSDAFAPTEPPLEKDSEPNRLLIGVGERCLDIEGGIATDGTPVQLFDCHRESNQRWQFIEDCDYGGCSEDFVIQGLNDLCLRQRQALRPHH